MNKDVEILKLTLQNEGLIFTKSIDELYNMAYAPLGIYTEKDEVTKKKINEWLFSRSIPASRQGIKEVLYYLDYASPELLIEKGFAFSLSDQYWLKPNHIDIQWRDLNFFTNDFSKDIGEMLFGKIPSGREINLASPDNTSDGVLKKRWQIMEGKRFLIKGGNAINQEPYNELIATKLNEMLNYYEYVPYDLIEIDERKYSRCECFIDADHELISAWDVYSFRKKAGSDSDYTHFLKVCESLGTPDVTKALNYLIVIDFILANKDRHWRNFGIIRDVNTLEISQFAPVFDCGTSLFTDIDITKIKSTQPKSKMFKEDFKKQLALVTDFSWIDFQALKEFPDLVASIFETNPNMDSRRIYSIAERVSNNIRLLDVYASMHEQSKEKVPIVEKIKESEEELDIEI